EYQHIDDAKQSLETAESIFETVESNYELVKHLTDLSHKHGLEKIGLTLLVDKLKKLQDVPQLIENVEEIEKDQQRLRELKQLQDDGNHLESRISSLVLKLRNYKDIDEVNNLLNNIKTLQEKLTANIFLRQLYQKYTQDVRVAENVLEKTKHVNEIEKTLNDTEIVLNSMHNLRNTKAEYQTTKNQLNALNTKLD